jgi:hypothetical protein
MRPTHDAPSRHLPGHPTGRDLVNGQQDGYNADDPDGVYETSAYVAYLRGIGEVAARRVHDFTELNNPAGYDEGDVT